MDLENLHKLFIHTLKDTYNAEVQISQALPNMHTVANTPSLKKAFSDHLMETEEHISRLEQVGEMLNVSLKGVECKGIKGLLKEGDEIIEADGDPITKDAALIAAAQKVEHYEMASYGTLVSMAELMGHTQAMKVLKETLEEEKRCDEILNSIAENEVNIKPNLD